MDYDIIILSMFVNRIESGGEQVEEDRFIPIVRQDRYVSVYIPLKRHYAKFFIIRKGYS